MRLSADFKRRRLAMNLTVTNEQMKAAEENADRMGISYLDLMQNAGRVCFETISRMISSPEEKSVVVLCGRGNNGGDGIVIADLLTKAGADVIVVFVSDLPKSECARKCYSMYETDLRVGMYVHNREAVMMALESCDAIVDCVFGTGFSGELEAGLRELFTFINDRCRAVKISIDIPSGCDSGTGAVAQGAFRPDVTIALAAMKKGMYSHPCFERCGRILIADIGIPSECFTGFEAVLTDSRVLDLIPDRKPVSHKGTYGKLLNISGSAHYTGAAMLSTDAALRMGVGLCTLATPVRVINAIATAIPEAIYIPLEHDYDGYINEKSIEIIEKDLSKNRYSAILIGCGLGNNQTAAEMTEYVIKNADCPVIIDADGLNSISRNINILKERKRDIIVTPHPAEFSRMTHISLRDIQNDRISSAKSFAAEYGVTTVLKGVNTVIASPNGEAFINTTGNAGLAKAGSGDVLAGMISSLTAQGTQPFYAAVLGAYMHGLASKKLSEKKTLYGMLPRDIPGILPELLND